MDAEFIKTISAIGGGLGGGWWLVSWGLKRYEKIQDELRKSRQRYTDQAINVVRNDNEKLERRFYEAVKQLEANTNQVTKLCVRIDNQKENVLQIMNILKEHINRTDRRLHDIEHAELVKLSDGNYILRKRRNGRS